MTTTITILLTFILNLPVVQAQVATLNEWDASLRERSLFSIVRVCTLMIFYCGWVTVHRNIPRQRESGIRALWGRYKMLLWVIVAPELVLAWAARQWAAARAIARIYNDHHVEARIKWTPIHGHFLIMGGFLVESPRDGKTHILSFEKFQDLVRRDLLEGTGITEITKDEILDRSKSDAPSKLVALLQTLWFILQCIARHMQHLPLTEFELVTLALSSVSGIMYFFWWHKPREVRVPMKVDLTKKSVPNLTNIDVSSGTTNEDLGNEIAESSRQALQTSPVPQSSPEIALPDILEKNDEQAPKTVFDFSAKEVKRACAGFLKALTSIITDKLWGNKQGNFFTRLLRLSHGIYLLPAYLLFLVFFLPIFVLLFIFASIRDVIDTVDIPFIATMVPTFYAPRTGKKRGIEFVVFAIIGIVYGGFHCMAWHFVFPTRADQMLWRTASVAITVLPLLSVLIGLIWDLSKEETLPQIKNQNRTIEKKIMGIIEVLTTIILIVLFFVHVSARLLLLGHAIWLLREQPVDVYRSVDWTFLLPHVL